MHYQELLYVVAHELFHAWNAKRLRPGGAGAVRPVAAQPARSLWITEGLTEYYAHRAMHLSGRWSRARYLERLGEESTARGERGAARAQRRGGRASWRGTQPDEAAADPDA